MERAPALVPRTEITVGRRSARCRAMHSIVCVPDQAGLHPNQGTRAGPHFGETRARRPESLVGTLVFPGGYGARMRG
jgi:hypothetical protein